MNIREIAALANLDLSPDEATALEQDLTSILDYIGQLTALDTTGIEPLAHALQLQAALAAAGEPPQPPGDRGEPAQPTAVPLRPDRAEIWFEQKQALANAPAAAQGMFQVPRILDRG